MSVCPDALLERDTRPVYGDEARRLIHGKTVLVTGAGGSIGSEIVLQCRELGAARIIKADADESALFGLSLNLYDHALFRPEEDHHLVDVADGQSIRRLMSTTRPDIVFHAAAKKHLPLTQAQPSIAVRTNVFGTAEVVNAAVECGVPHVVNISTDKAADPTSVLGWTKRLAELVAASLSTTETRVASVRFGNVLGSRGSLLPTLQHQLDKGKRVRLTHAEAKRYFMTIPEAAGLVIEAARMVEGGDVFVLDMGQPVKIAHLIRTYAELANHPSPRFETTGLRPGEKIEEVLFTSGSESIARTSHPRIMKAVLESDVNVPDKLRELAKLLDDGATPVQLRQALVLV